ncbi:hypothetical protein LZ32DRAFT_598350, partial [Colletotrichum eremochloae]
MILAKSLDIRYIWVDALCIIRDDTDDELHITPIMDVMYGNSALNICAAVSGSFSHRIPRPPSSQRAKGRMRRARALGNRDRRGLWRWSARPCNRSRRTWFGSTSSSPAA